MGSFFVAETPKSRHPNVPLLLGASLFNNHHMKNKQTDKAMQGNKRKQLLQKSEFALYAQKKEK